MDLREIKYIKTELQSYGVRLDSKDIKHGGAGPAEGNTIVFNDKTVATVPIGSRFVSDSPYSIVKENESFILKKSGKDLLEASFLPAPKFYSHKDEQGTPYWKIALRHGRDCLASTVVQRCVYWGSKNQCGFCGIELSLNSGQTIALKTPGQLSQVAKKAHELDDLKHITLTTGSQSDTRNFIDHLVLCINEIKENVDIPIHVQIEPAYDESIIGLLKEADADTIGIHIECFDMEILKKIAPAKAAFGLKRYETYWKNAVDLFGPNQVSSFLIAGLGENEKTIIDGCEYLAELGVYPYLLPLRPIPGSLMEDSIPPDPGIMIDLYEEISLILAGAGLNAKNSKAGCVRCGACSAGAEFENL